MCAIMKPTPLFPDVPIGRFCWVYLTSGNNTVPELLLNKPTLTDSSKFSHISECVSSTSQTALGKPLDCQHHRRRVLLWETESGRERLEGELAGQASLNKRGAERSVWLCNFNSKQVCSADVATGRVRPLVLSSLCFSFSLASGRAAGGLRRKTCECWSLGHVPGGFRLFIPRDGGCNYIP